METEKNNEASLPDQIAAQFVDMLKTTPGFGERLAESVKNLAEAGELSDVDKVYDTLAEFEGEQGGVS